MVLTYHVERITGVVMLHHGGVVVVLHHGGVLESDAALPLSGKCHMPNVICVMVLASFC